MLLSELANRVSPWLAGVTGDAGVEIAGATADSRQVRPGMLFCAIRGAVTDGNRFIDAALAAGATAIASDRGGDSAALAELPVPVLRIRPGAGYHCVARIAAEMGGNPAAKLQLYGITGTCGKTTTAYLLRECFRGAGIKTGMIGTVVYDTGAEEIPADRTTPTPFELQELFQKMVYCGCQRVVMEVSSAALDQERFGDVQFDGAIFTNFSRDHLDYHGDMEAYYQAKEKLFTKFLKSDGVAVVNRDDEYGRRIVSALKNRRCRTFAADDWRTEDPLRLPGLFNRYNAAGAVALAEECGIDGTLARRIIGASVGAPGRVQPVDLPNGARAYVDYAHTPEAIAKVLETLRPECTGALAIVFGCGGDRDRGKRPLMGAAAAMADRIYVTSDNPRTESPQSIIADILPGIPAGRQVVVEEDRRAAILRAVADSVADDVVLVAGKGHETYQEIGGAKLSFDDSEVLKEVSNEQ